MIVPPFAFKEGKSILDENPAPNLDILPPLAASTGNASACNSVKLSSNTTSSSGIEATIAALPKKVETQGTAYEFLQTSCVTLSTKVDRLSRQVAGLKIDRNMLLHDKFLLCKGDLVLAVGKKALSSATKITSPRGPTKKRPLWKRITSERNNVAHETTAEFCKVLSHKNYIQEKAYWSPIIKWSEKKTLKKY
ncbi:MAG: hypothetical protein MMC33_004772 [Icmadophila ericetorum]|nr:hypothetical protein [Icmadophila ericetorum]